MDIITITKENLKNEHICCAISNKEDIQVTSKKSWIAERLDEGLVFKKGNVRGKCFIEYIPAEKAWAPIEAPGYMYIDCLWVSGQFKGQGNSSMLLEECIRDSKEKGMKGLVILSSKKKMPFIADPKYLRHKGFKLADTAEPYFELLYLPFDNTAEIPKFKQSVKNTTIQGKGMVLYYTAQCPFTAKYAPLIEVVANENDISFKSVKIETAAEAQNAPSPFTTYCLFYKGKFVTHEILSENKFLKIAKALTSE
ncbi:N-acetyltransferase [Prevotella sp.]|uniref:GNAT family N-acetyltransferase n=1 Tax=Prevotella sp. TaxID=59823 RepID=UPI003DA36BD3